MDDKEIGRGPGERMSPIDTKRLAVWNMHLMPSGDVTAVGTFIQLPGGIGPDMQTLHITDAGASTIQRVRLPVAGRLCTRINDAPPV